MTVKQRAALCDQYPRSSDVSSNLLRLSRSLWMGLALAAINGDTGFGDAGRFVCTGHHPLLGPRQVSEIQKALLNPEFK